MSVRVRIAPSPTGNLHIGTVRTALFNWLFARHHGGQFIIRIEDTDLERSKKEYEENIISGLAWLGLTSDVPITRQTERLSIYRKYLEQLLGSGKAFWCHHAKEELEAEQKGQMARKEAPRHICDHKGTDKASVKGQLIRLAVNAASERKIVFDDAVRGKVEWTEGHIGDLSLAKDLDTPLYNFAVVVDDIEMGISHVVRGEEHISNTPKQILIYEALGKAHPVFAHLPLILNPDKTKLSKRVGATSVGEYKKDYLPAALINFLGFLGYTYSKELISKEEMATEFDLMKVHKSGAVFNIEKLNWLNAQYVKKLSAPEFKTLTGLAEMPDAALPLITERLERLSDAAAFSYFWELPAYDASLLHWKGSTGEEVVPALRAVRELLETFDFVSKERLRAGLDELGARHKNRGLVYWPLRVALSGKERSPDPVDIAFVLGGQETLRRVDLALSKLE